MKQIKFSFCKKNVVFFVYFVTAFTKTFSHISFNRLSFIALLLLLNLTMPRRVILLMPSHESLSVHYCFVKMKIQTFNFVTDLTHEKNKKKNNKNNFIFIESDNRITPYVIAPPYLFIRTTLFKPR